MLIDAEPIQSGSKALRSLLLEPAMVTPSILLFLFPTFLLFCLLSLSLSLYLFFIYFYLFQQKRIMLNIHGHTHHALGMTRVGKTFILNPGSLRYDLSYSHSLLSLCFFFFFFSSFYFVFLLGYFIYFLFIYILGLGTLGSYH